MKTKTTKYSKGILIYQRTADLNEFLCESCNQQKKSKIIVKLKTNEGITKTICNGCYGNLLSREN